MSKDPKLPFPIMRSLSEAESECERELNVRNRCFPGWISDGRVNRIDAIDRRDRLQTAMLVLSIIQSDATVQAFVEERMKAVQQVADQATAVTT